MSRPLIRAGNASVSAGRAGELVIAWPPLYNADGLPLDRLCRRRWLLLLFLGEFQSCWTPPKVD